MNKIRHIFSNIQPKSIIYFGLILLLLFIFWFWFKNKSVETVKDHRFLIGIDNRWFPLDLRGQESYMQGFVSELTTQIATKEDLKIQLVPVATSQLFDNLDKEYYDAVFSSLSPNVLNERKYYFSDTIYSVGPVLIVPKYSKATSIDQLHNVGVKTGFSGIFAASGSPLTSVITYNNMNLALSDLDMGKIDGLVMGSIDAYAYIKGFYLDKLKVVTPPLTKEGLRLVTLNNHLNKEFIKLFNEGLKEIKEEGDYEKILHNWNLIDPEKAYLEPI